MDARRDGYRTYLYFICVEPVDSNIARISNRVGAGGHDVPNDKVLKRYLGSLSLLWNAICLVDRAYLFDNSGMQHRLVAEFESANIVLASTDLPNWFVDHVGPAIEGWA